MRKNIKKLLLAAFVMAATFILAPSVDAKAYGITQVNPAKDSITVQWTPESRSVINYMVYVGTSSSDAVLVATLPSTATSYKVANLPAGVERYVKVAYTYKSSSSNTIYDSYVGYERCRTIPVVVNNVRQERWYYYLKSFDVKWDELEAADSYEYELYNSKGKRIKTGTTSSTSMEHSKKVSNNMIYKVRVRATSQIAGQTYTTAWSPYCYCFTQPRVKSVKVSGSKLTVKWQKISGATGYDIYVSTKKTKGYKKVKSVGKNASSVTIKKFKGKKFKSSKRYYVYVAATKKANGTKYDSGRLYYWNSKDSGSGYF